MAGFSGERHHLRDPMTEKRVRSAWYYNPWAVVFAIFFVLGPFGLPLVWRNPRFSHGVKLVLTACVMAYTAVLVAATVRAIQVVIGVVDTLQ